MLSRLFLLSSQILEFLHRGQNVNAIDVSSCTALHIAAGAGRNEIVSLLLERGAIVEAADKHAQTPAHYAVR